MNNSKTTILTPENIAMLDDADLAAFAHRREWLRGARSEKRQGKQIPPDGDWQITLLRAGRGFGKLLNIETNLPTLDGWIKMAHIRVGDKVFDEYGRICNVTFVSDEEIPSKAYRLTFSDNTYIDACSEHQWVILENDRPKIVLSQNIYDSMAARGEKVFLKDPLLGRSVVCCEPITPMPMRCISVDSPSAMYLAGDGMIPTHNTKALNEWQWWELWRCPGIIGHAIAPTLSDVRGTTFEGPAGFCSIIPAECLKGGTLEKAYNKSTHELRLSNGSLLRGFSATDDGSRLRGPQAHNITGDEIAQWDKPAGNLEQVISNALFGLRLKYPDGTPSRAVFGTTPLPIPFLKRFEKREGVRLVTGTSYENLENLDDNFRVQLRAMAGTLLGRQEIDGAYIDEESDRSIIKRRWINLFPYYMPDGVTKRKLPMFSFIIEAYDTATSEHNVDKKRQTTDPSGSIVLGVFNVNQYFTEAERRRMNCKSKYAALLCDAWTEHLGLPELLEKARNQHRIKWGSDPARRPDITLIEDKSSGPSLRQFLVKYGVPCYAYNPGKENKTTRLHAISPLVNQGMLFVPESDISKRPDRKGLPRDWVEPFLEQVCAFSGPGSTEHDEFVDTFSSAMSYLRNRGILDATPDEPYIDRDEKIDADRGEARRIHNSTRPRITPNPYA